MTENEVRQMAAGARRRVAEWNRLNPHASGDTPRPVRNLVAEALVAAVVEHRLRGTWYGRRYLRRGRAMGVR